MPEKEFLLRITSSIKEKLLKFQDYIKKGIVQKEDHLIIGISSCALSQYGSLMDYPVPTPLKVLRRVGHECINLNIGQGFLLPREPITKMSGNQVDVNWFDREDMQIIAGILYSYCDPLNSPDDPEKTFILFLNPNAHSPIDKAIFDGIPIY